MGLRVSIDGGVTWQEVTEVRVEAPDDDGRDFTFTMTMTSEGVIQDWWSKGSNEECLHTGCTLWDDVVDVIGGRE